MKTSLVAIDSEVWGRPVLSLSDVHEGDSLSDLEADYVREFGPAYVAVKIPLEEVSLVHRFEAIGFSFVECQLRLLARFRADYDVSRYAFDFEEVKSPEALEAVLEIARQSITHDRFSVDPGVPRGFSGRRYEAYVRQSWEREDEEVWRVVDRANGATVAFRTHRRTAPGEVLMLVGGVRPEMKGLGLGVVSSHLFFNQMRRSGIKRGITHISVGNGPILDLEVGHFGFSYQQAFAVLRKLYP